MAGIKKVCQGYGLLWNSITNVATADLKALVTKAFDIARLQRLQSLYAKGPSSPSGWVDELPESVRFVISTDACRVGSTCNFFLKKNFPTNLTCVW